jgi:hypothetical protein
MVEHTVSAHWDLGGKSFGISSDGRPLFDGQTLLTEDLSGEASVANFGAAGDGVADDSPAINAAIDAAIASGRLVVDLPPGIYRYVTPHAVMTVPVSFRGAGNLKTIIKVDPALTGGYVFAWSEVWEGAPGPSPWPVGTDTVTLANNRAGVLVSGLSLVGDRDAGATQNGFLFYDAADFVLFHDVSAYYLKGSAIKTGVALNTASSFMRESSFDKLRLWYCGTATDPVLSFGSVGATIANNEIDFGLVEMYAPMGDGFVMDNDSSVGISRDYRIAQLRIEGLEAGDQLGDLIRIGSSTKQGQIRDVQIGQVRLINPYTSYAAMRVTASTGSLRPFFIHVGEGNIGQATLGSAVGLSLDACRDSHFHFPNITTVGSEVVIGADCTSHITVDGDGNEQSWTWSINAAATKAIAFPVRTIGLNGAGSVQANPHDASATGGNVPGVGAVDMQVVRSAATQVASGIGSTLAGGNSNVAAGTGASIGGGFSNVGSGDYSATAGGRQGNARSRYGVQYWASGIFAAQGDAQNAMQVLRGSGATASAFRLTADAAAVGANNSFNIPNATSFRFRVELMATDITTRGKDYSYAVDGIVTRDANAASTAVALGTPVEINRGTVTGAVATVTADTTNGAVNVSFAPPTSNTDTWHAVASIRATEVQ